MQAGFAEIVITPPKATCLLAGYALYPATGVHDDLYASAVYLQDDQQRALLVSFDLLAMEAPLIARLKQAITAVLVIDPGAIFLPVRTHTKDRKCASANSATAGMAKIGPHT